MKVLRELIDQALQCNFTIAKLRRGVLRDRAYAGGKVGEPNGGVGFVDVLPARATGAIDVDADVLKQRFSIKPLVCHDVGL